MHTDGMRKKAGFYTNNGDSSSKLVYGEEGGRKSPLERIKGIGHSTGANGRVLYNEHVDGEEEGKENGRESEMCV